MLVLIFFILKIRNLKYFVLTIYIQLWLNSKCICISNFIEIRKIGHKIATTLFLIVNVWYFSAHPNVKAFVTHGGLLSTTEAVYYGVPLVGIPFFGDQYMNVLGCVRDGYAIHLPYDELTGNSLTGAVTELIQNPR